MSTRIRGFAHLATPSPVVPSPLATPRAGPEPVPFRWRASDGTPQALEAAEHVVASISASHRAAAERLLAFARFGVAIVQALVLSLPFGHSHFEFAHPLAWAYAAWAAGLFLLIWERPRLQPSTCELLHVSDLAWTGVISALSGGVSSHCYPLFALVVVSAGYRWGLKRALAYGGGVVVIAVAESAMSVFGLTPWVFEVDMFLLRVGYIIVLAVLFGALAEGQIGLRFQALSVGGLMARLSQSTLVQPAVRSFIGELGHILNARSVALVLHERDAANATLWLSSRGPEGVKVARRSLSPAERDLWLHPLSRDVGSLQMRRPDASQPPTVTIALDRAGNRMVTSPDVPAAVARELAWDTSLVAAIDYKDAGGARLYVFDPEVRPGGVVRLGFVQSLAEQIGPPLLNFYLLRRLRSSVATTERARVAHELHDGPVQTLLGLELRMEALRRLAGADTALAREIGELQGVVRGGARDLRELIELLRPVSVEPEGLGVALQDLVQRFGQNNGIESSLEWAAGRLEVAERQAHDVYRLAQEALVNVRRHSGATRVRVRLEADADDVTLVVHDNGKGMGFRGRLSHEELAMQHAGPRVLRERLEIMGGRLLVDSSMTGTRLEMRFPRYAAE